MATISRGVIVVPVAATLLTAAPAFAAHELDPGLWQLTETGTENGQPAKPEVSMDCLSPEDARDPVKTILKDTEGQPCETRKVQENGNTAVVALKCGDPKTTRIEIDMTVNFENARTIAGRASP